jgi:Tfp pilus assembly protein PilF
MNPEHAAAHFWAGQTYTEQGQFPLALQEFDVALRFDPDNVAAYHNRGTVAYRLGNLDQARSDLQTALERDPDDPRSHYQLGAIYLALALPESQDLLATPDPALLEQSRVAFAAALERCPGMIESLIGMGNLYIIQGDATAALEPLNQAVEQVPDQPETWFALAQAHAMLGQTETACSDLDQFLSLSVPTEWQEQAGQMRTQLGCP